MPDMSPAQTAGVADSFFQKMADEAKVLEASERQLKANIAGLSKERDAIAAELQDMAAKRTTIRAHQKSAEDTAAKVIAEAGAAAAKMLEDCRVQIKTETAEFRARIAAAEAAFGNVK